MCVSNGSEPRIFEMNGLRTDDKDLAFILFQRALQNTSFGVSTPLGVGDEILQSSKRRRVTVAATPTKLGSFSLN